MPQPTQHSLIHILLLWTTILSIVQAVFIILFFTVGHHSPSQNSSAVAPERPMQFQTPLSPSENGLLLGKGKMLTFKATKANETIKWVTKDQNNHLVSEGEVLTIKKDGYYFLNLQVTLKSVRSQQKVTLTRNDKVLLQGYINASTGSTGLLSKVEELTADSTLVVTISQPTTDIDESEYLTHLDIIYMQRP